MKQQLSNFTLHRGNVFIPLRIGRNIIKRHKQVSGARFWSKQHCVIFVKEIKEKPVILLMDQSRNGTYINSSVLRKKGTFLDQHDTIGFGSPLSLFVLEKIKTINIE